MTVCWPPLQNITDGTLLATLNATDVDYQINAIVVYTFENGSDVSGPFSLDLNTGELRTRAMIDREQTDSYMVSVHVVHMCVWSC